tara:strand:- start:1935 stop:2327 length:393 start_codon:yes stop_codon:yes gene_type:complete
MMRKFIVYTEAGDILRTGICPDGSLELQKADGQLVMEGTANDATQRVVDGKVVDKPEPPDSDKNVFAMSDLRSARDQILQSSDWTQLPDSPLAEGKKIEWQEYREKLRNLPSENQDILDIDDVSFPAPPA